MGFLDKLIGFAAKTAIEAAGYSKNPLCKTAHKIGKFGVEVGKAFGVSAEVHSQIAPVLAEMMTDEISIDSFNYIYDLRTYDFNSQQCDIRAMKHLDSEGVYAFHNLTDDTYYVGKATYLFRKIKRIIEGYDNPVIHEQMMDGYEFAISAVRLMDTNYDTIEELMRYYKSRYLD